MKNEEDDFLKDLTQENDEFKENPDPFADDESVEESKEEVVEKVEKPLAFHKDPKVQKFIAKEVAKRISEMGTPEPARKVDESVDDYYERLIGNDTPEKVAMIREAKLRDERLLEQAEERAYGRLTAEQQKEVEADSQAEEELDTALEEIEENFEVDISSNDPVARKTRVDFLKFVEKIAPKDKNGDIIDYPDMHSAFETFQENRKTAPSTRAKDLAARSMNRSSEVSGKPQERVTFDSIGNVFEKMFSK